MIDSAQRSGGTCLKILFAILFRSQLFTVRFSSSVVKAKNASNFMLYHVASTPQKWAGPLIYERSIRKYKINFHL